jgi:S1-C subfamily serine protease
MALAGSALGLPAQEQSRPKLEEPSFFAYNFDAYAGDLRTLLNRKALDDAAALYALHADHFKSKAGKFDYYLFKLADGLNARFEAEDGAPEKVVLAFQEADVVAPGTWASLRAALAALSGHDEAYGRTLLLQDPKFTSAVMQRRRAATAKCLATLRDQANAAFLQTFACTAPSFLATYPVILPDREAFLEQHFAFLADRLQQADAEGVATFWRNYGGSLPSGRAALVGRTYVKAKVAALGTPSLPNLLGAVAAARGLGLQQGLGEVYAIRATNATQPDHFAKPGDFPVELLDLGRSALAPAPAAGPGGDLEILVRLKTTAADRKITDKQELASRFRTGSRMVPNPGYNAAMVNYNNAQQHYNEVVNWANNQQVPQGQGVWGAIAAAAQVALIQGTVAGARSDLDTASQTFARTPNQVSEDLFQNYTFNVNTVSVSKVIEAEVFVVNHLTGATEMQAVTLNRQASFRIAYNVHAEDPGRARHLEQCTTEAAIAEHEARAETLALEELLKGLDPKEARTLPAAEARIQAFRPAETKGRAGKASLATADARLASVVLVEAPGQGVGSAFYVTATTLLTHARLAEKAKFVEIRNSRGKTALAKVVKIDKDLDLALLKTTLEGLPLAFADDDIAPGTAVATLGHPAGLAFTLGHGTVGALRFMSNPQLPGSRKRLVVQTDAPLSPGGAGGPLLLGDRVLGLCTPSLVGKEAQGLGFALHASELKRFLDLE